MAVGQIEYRDRLFNYLFGREEHRDWTLDLYNAVNGSSYDDPSDIQINTIREVLYMGMHNDVSFLIMHELNLWEQQSTFNPNMPLRLMQYTGNLYEKYIKENSFNKYGKELISLPAPKYVVFYNGKEPQPDDLILRLSDAFPENAKSDLEATVRMINVNWSHNQELLDACQPLKEYAWLMDRIGKNRQAKMELAKAIDFSIDEMPGDFILKAFLEAHRTEVSGLLLTEYNEAETMEMFKLDGERIGTDKTFDLTEKLFAQGRVDDIHRAAKDVVYRQKLFDEFGIK